MPANFLKRVVKRFLTRFRRIFNKNKTDDVSTYVPGGLVGMGQHLIIRRTFALFR